MVGMFAKAFEKVRQWGNDLILVASIWALLGAAVLAAVWKYWTQYAPLITAGAVGFVLVFVGIVAYQILRRSEKAVPVDVENIEATVRRWADELGWGIQRIEDTGAFFALKFTLPSSSESFVVASRMKALPRYLAVVVAVRLTADDITALNRLPRGEANAFASSIRLEMSRAKIEYRNLDLPLTEPLSLQRTLPITAALTEDSFMASVHSVITAKNLLSELIVNKLRIPAGSHG